MLQRGKNAVQQNMKIAKECQAWKCTILKQCTRTYTHFCWFFQHNHALYINMRYRLTRTVICNWTTFNIRWTFQGTTHCLCEIEKLSTLIWCSIVYNLSIAVQTNNFRCVRVCVMTSDQISLVLHRPTIISLVTCRDHENIWSFCFTNSTRDVLLVYLFTKELLRSWSEFIFAPINQHAAIVSILLVRPKWIFWQTKVT